MKNLSARIAIVVLLGILIIGGYQWWCGHTLNQRLISRDDKVRTQALLELSQASPASKDVHLRWLIGILEHGTPSERSIAAVTLGNAGWHAQMAVPALISALKFHDKKLVRNVLTGLGDLGVKAKDAAPYVYPYLKDSDSTIRILAAIALVSMKVPNVVRPDVLKALTDGFHERVPWIQEKSITSVAALGPAAAPALPQLIQEARTNRNERLRFTAVWALGRVAKNPNDVKPVLIQIMDTFSENVRMNALMSLQWVDPNILQTDPKMAQIAHDLMVKKALDSGLLYTATEGDPKDVDAVLNLGANVNAKDFNTGKTALMISAERGFVDEVQLLLKRGADVHTRSDSQGLDPRVMEASSIRGTWALLMDQMVRPWAYHFMFWSYSGKTALEYARDADIPPADKSEIINLLNKDGTPLVPSRIGGDR